jgi:DNA invertase Pin-like site-specific DNA recombinase
VWGECRPPSPESSVRIVSTRHRQLGNEVIGSREAQGILAWHPDRLARNSIDGGRIIYLLDTGKILDLKFPTFWFDSTPQGKFMLNIAFGQSKYYVDNLSENIKRGHRQKLRKGIWPGFAPRLAISSTTRGRKA